MRVLEDHGHKLQTPSLDTWSLWLRGLSLATCSMAAGIETDFRITFFPKIYAEESKGQESQ